MAPRVQEVLADRYEVLDVLGRGGMGVVYRATDRVLARLVAVKVLPIDRAEDRTFVARFEREALAAAALSHPNIVAVFDSDRDGPTRFIVMEYVSGASLAALVRRRGPLAARESVAIAAQIAGALAAAHKAGIVHRDIKPANVMVDGHGNVKVLDFGIARAAASTTLTHTAVVVGSAAYMAPEVSRGQTADARSDIYSLGCVLYELLTGRPPFTGELPAAILHQHNTVIPQPPRARNPAVPPGLDALVMQMLAKDPGQRPQTARQLVKALPAWLADTTAVTTVTRRAGTHTQPTRVLPRHRRLGRGERLVLAIAALILVVGVALALLESSGSKPKTEASRSTTASGRTSATYPAPRTVAGAGGALTSLATQDLQNGNIDQPAAQAILTHLQDILTAYDNGHPTDALQHTTDLSTQINQLSSHGDIKPSALPALTTAIGNLRSALQRSRPTTTAAAPTTVPPATSTPQPTAPKAPAPAPAPKHPAPAPKPPAPPKAPAPAPGPAHH